MKYIVGLFSKTSLHCCWLVRILDTSVVTTNAADKKVKSTTAGSAIRLGLFAPS
ncbi:MAG: hypothetical protein JO251_17025 [Verrucomicrobia bacterium]|nr:hypothetical protein [Verrucomicrobiota bacterium]